MSTKSDYRVTKGGHLAGRRVKEGDIVSLTVAQANYAHVTPVATSTPSKAARRTEAETSE